MGGNISKATLLAALYPLTSPCTMAFVPSHTAIFGTISSGWTGSKQKHISGCMEPRERWTRSRRRSRGVSSEPLVQMQMDPDTGTEASSSTPLSAAVPAASPIVEFDGIEATREGEVDSFLGELDFCLGPSDSVLSAASITKDLNTATNKMVKNLLILNSPEDEQPAMRDVENIEAAFEADHAESSQYAEMKVYLSCVCQLAKEGCPSQETLEGLSEPYKLAFRRVGGVLSEFGCSVTPGKSGRVRPADKDICLSILDYTLSEKESATSTRSLNTLANRVIRTVCVGSDKDLQGLALEMDAKRQKFMGKWIGEGWEESQEDMFYCALVSLVRNGLTDEDPALHGAYLNSYQRLMGIVVQEVGTRSTPASEMVIKSFLSWEREIRKELTEPAWESKPRDLVGSWALETAGLGGLSDKTIDGAEMEDLRLNDLVVAFQKDGSVKIPVEKGVGLEWRVEPGPTHLDTVYFEMIPAAPVVQGSPDAGAGGGTTLSYTGYVDRGARIEARFSKRFLKMTGRMTSISRGQERPSTRFAMRLVEKGDLKSNFKSKDPAA